MSLTALNWRNGPTWATVWESTSSDRSGVVMQTHGDHKYRDTSVLSGARDWNMLRVEHRQVASGSYNAVRPECTELVHILSGRATVRRRADGPLQERLA